MIGRVCGRVGWLAGRVGWLLAGWLVDSSSGVLGYRRYFGVLALIAVTGFVATILLTAVTKRVFRKRDSEAL